MAQESGSGKKDDGFLVGTKPFAKGDEPVAGKGGFLPVYGTSKVQEMRKRSLAQMAADKEATKEATKKSPTVARSMSKR